MGEILPIYASEKSSFKICPIPFYTSLKVSLNQTDRSLSALRAENRGKNTTKSNSY